MKLIFYNNCRYSKLDLWDNGVVNSKDLAPNLLKD